jgi:1-acyl-sn-glycerol-3-phosphate acyltransferase
MGVSTHGLARKTMSALTWVAIGLLLLVWLPLMAIVRLFDRDPAHYATGRLFRKVGALITRVNPAWRIERSGRLPSDPRRPYVVVGNHQGNADIPVVSILPWDMKWVAKAEMFRLPVVGWLMRLAGDIAVDRNDPQSRAATLRRARHYLERHCSVMFMPEGTRSRDSRVRPFHDGAFRLAIETGVPILPLAIDGTANALPAYGWVFGPVRCRLHVLDPVETVGYSPAQAPELRERVRQSIIDQIAQWRGVSPAELDGGHGGVEDGTNRPSGAPLAGGRGCPPPARAPSLTVFRRRRVGTAR